MSPWAYRVRRTTTGWSRAGRVLLDQDPASNRYAVESSGQLALAHLKQWGEPVDDLFVRRSSGPVTARAATLLAELDAYLIEESRGRRSLDDVIGRMIESEQQYTYRSLCVAAKHVARQPVPPLSPDAVPGAPAEPECMITR